MDARMRAEAITTRLGAVALPLGVILLVVATAIHPSREEPMDNPAIFTEYAQSNSWVAVHLAQWFAILLIIGGLVALYYSITAKPEANAAVARFGLAGALLTGASLTMLQAVDGVALKRAVDAWASAPTDQEAAAFDYRSSEVDRVCPSELLRHPAGTHPYSAWAGYRVGHRLPRLARVDSRGLRSRMDRARTDDALHRLLRLDPQAGGPSSHGLVGVHHGCLMWRNSSRGRLARPESAPPDPARPPASPR